MCMNNNLDLLNYVSAICLIVEIKRYSIYEIGNNLVHCWLKFSLYFLLRLCCY